LRTVWLSWHWSCVLRTIKRYLLFLVTGALAMVFGLREKLVAWLETKTVDDLVYVKKNPDVGIFLKHP